MFEKGRETRAGGAGSVKTGKDRRRKEERRGSSKKGKRTRVTVIGIFIGLPLRDLDVVLRDDLVERVCAAAELLAGVAVAVILIPSASDLVRHPFSDLIFFDICPQPFLGYFICGKVHRDNIPASIILRFRSAERVDEKGDGEETYQRMCEASDNFAVHSVCPQWQRPW